MLLLLLKFYGLQRTLLLITPEFNRSSYAFIISYYLPFPEFKIKKKKNFKLPTCDFLSLSISLIFLPALIVYSWLLFSRLIFTQLLQLRISFTLKNYKTTICPATCQTLTHTPIFPIPNIPIPAAYVLAQLCPADFLGPHGLQPSIIHGTLGFSRQEYLEWVAISSSRGSFRPWDQIHVSYTGRQILYLEPPRNPNSSWLSTNIYVLSIIITQHYWRQLMPYTSQNVSPLAHNYY